MQIFLINDSHASVAAILLNNNQPPINVKYKADSTLTGDSALCMRSPDDDHAPRRGRTCARALTADCSIIHRLNAWKR